MQESLLPSFRSSSFIFSNAIQKMLQRKLGVRVCVPGVRMCFLVIAGGKELPVLPRVSR